MSTFGFAESAAPVPGVAVLRTGNTNICLLEKGWHQSLDSLRRNTPHECHWTPVHLDIPTILIVDIGHDTVERARCRY